MVRRVSDSFIVLSFVQVHYSVDIYANLHLVYATNKIEPKQRFV